MKNKVILSAVLLGAIVLGIFYTLKMRERISLVAPLVAYNATTSSALIHMSFPKSSDAMYPEINAYITQVKDDFTKQFANLTPQEIKDQYGREDVQFQLFTDTKVATSTKTISYIISVYEYTGGAHGGTAVSTFTYDLAGRRITLRDVFKGDYLPTVAALAKQYAYANFGQYSQPQMIDPGVAPRDENFKAWYLTDKTITFIFQQYQIGPYAMGIQEFPLPKTQVETILNPTYKAVQP